MYIGNQPTSQAFVTDYFNGDGTTVAYTMSVAPANSSSIEVIVAGVPQYPNTYSVNSTTLTFSAAPPAGTGNIFVRYLGIPASGVTTTAYRTVTEFTATASQTTFTPPTYTVGYINVYQNGSLLGSADYTATNGTTVVLAVGATVGDLVVVESFYVSSVINAIPAVNGAVGSTYLASSSVITSKIAAGAVGTTQIASGAVTQSVLGTGVAGNGPTFSAYQSSSQTLTSGVMTKIQFQAEEWDSASCFDSTTNYRFTPNVAGYYSITGKIQPNNTYSAGIIAVYKNGALYKYGNYNNNTSATAISSMTCLVYLNGTTDYVELWASLYSGQPLVATADMTYFQGFLARAA